MLLLLHGLRRGEVLGLRWADSDLGGGEIRVRQQIGRVNGELRVGPVKTNAGRRDLPMLPLAVDVFGIRHEAQAADREEQSWSRPAPARLSDAERVSNLGVNRHLSIFVLSVLPGQAFTFGCYLLERLLIGGSAAL